MRITSLLHRLESAFAWTRDAAFATSAQTVRSGRRRSVPRFDVLEGRALPSTFTVLNLADSGDGSLRAAIAAAAGNPGPDVVEFDKKVHGKITLTSGELAITSDLTIVGPGANKLTVSGNHASRVFNVQGGANANTAIDVTISGLTVSDGRGLSTGGGIRNTRFSTTTLSHVLVSGNEVVANFANGGGIQNSGFGANMTLMDCVVSGNVANPELTGFFSGTASFGGGISNINGANLTVINSAVSDNQVISFSLALGGGIHQNVGTTVTVVNSTITNNKAIGVAPDGYGVGGGFSNFDGILLSISSASRISNNIATGDQAIGGGIAGSSPNVLGGGVISVANSILSDNRAVAVGGRMHAGDDVSIATAFGGAIYSDSHLEVSDSVLRGNQAMGGNNSTHDAPNISDAGGAHGGAIYNTSGGEAIIRDSLIEYNRAIGGSNNAGSGPVAFAGTATGGGVDNALDLAAIIGGEAVPARLALTNTTLAHNEAIGGDQNTATGDMPFAGAGLGGAVANYLGATTDMSESVLHHNRATGGDGNTSIGGLVPASLGAGGAIFNALGNFELDSGDVLSPSIVNLSNSTLVHNKAQGGKGIDGNVAGDGWGGASAALFSATTNVIDSLLANNFANGGQGVASGNGGNGYGGGAYNDATSSLRLKRSAVTRNHANGGEAGAGGSDGEGVGGGVYNLWLFEFDDLTIIDANHASTSDDDIFGWL